MKKIIILICLTCFFVLKGQYSTYAITNVGFISISDEMELQSGDYRNLSEKVQQYVAKTKGYILDFQNRFVFQPKGINSLENLNSYARIIIETEFGNYNYLSSIKPTISAQEMRELNSIIKSQTIESFRGTQIKLLNFYGANFEKINNQVALKVSYTRQFANNSPVRVDVYKFENRDRLHTITLSYRIEQENFWKEKLKSALNSFKIIKQ